MAVHAVLSRAETGGDPEPVRWFDGDPVARTTTADM
jgi:hypothetical protein